MEQLKQQLKPLLDNVGVKELGVALALALAAIAYAVSSTSPPAPEVPRPPS